MSTLRPSRSAVAAVIAVTLTLLALSVLSASADPPPSAAGTTSHGFLASVES